MVGLFLVVLLIALASLVSAPSFAQSASGDQYGSAGEDQYESPPGTIGGDTTHGAPGPFGSASSGATGASTENGHGATATPVFGFASSGATGASTENGHGATGAPTENEPGVGPTQSEATHDEDAASEDGAAATGSGEAPTESGANDEEDRELDELPETDGVSPLWAGALLVVSGLLVYGVTRGVRTR